MGRKALSKDAIDAQSGGSGAEFSLPDDALLALVDLGIRAKMDMLLHDAYEKTTAMVFEYGHTMSHAIEKTYGDGVVPHGLGVTVQRWPLPQPLPPSAEVMARAMKDSKRGITSE